MSNGTPQPPPPDNNTANALNDSGVTNTNAVNLIGSWVGTIADWSGGFGFILTIYNAMVNLFNPDTNQVTQTIIAALNNAFAQLNAIDKAERIINRWNNVQTDIGPAESQLQGLSTLVTGLPLTPFQIFQVIGPCTTPLNDLGYDTNGGMPAWSAVYSDQVYWTDAGLYQLTVFNQDSNNNWVYWGSADVGYGLQAPPTPSEDIVFNTRFVLPTYLEAVSIFLIVGKAIDPQFTTGYAGALRGVAELLSEVHDKVANTGKTPSEGIIQLSPPGPWTTAGLLFSLEQTSITGGAGGDMPGVTALAWSGGGIYTPVPTGLSIEYGAVETFSGYSSIGNYTIDFGTYPASSDPTLFQKFQVRLLKKAKDVYAGIGLTQVWKVIKQLKILVGDPVSPTPCFGDWSFRELFQVSGISSRSDGLLHATDVAMLLINTPPDDTATNAPSFRNLLSPLS